MPSTIPVSNTDIIKASINGNEQLIFATDSVVNNSTTNTL